MTYIGHTQAVGWLVLGQNSNQPSLPFIATFIILQLKNSNMQNGCCSEQSGLDISTPILNCCTLEERYIDLKEFSKK